MKRDQRSFADLIRHLDGVPFGPWEQVLVAGIAIDSRRVEPGDLFVAIKGERTDGTRFVRDAVSRGAAAVVVPPDAPPDAIPDAHLDTGPAEGVPGIRVGDTRRALPAIAARFYGHPARSLRVIGVTGTNGKTTTVCMIAALLRAAGEDAGLLTTAEVDTGRQRFRPEYTTPEAHDLHRYFREMVDCGMRYACMEVSSHGVVLDRVRGIDFHAGVVTNITPDHQDFHPTFEHYLAAKRAFVERLGDSAACLLNTEDERVLGMAAVARARVIPYGFSDAAVVRACDVDYGPAGTRFTVRTDGTLLHPNLSAGTAESFPVEVPLPGRHNVLNTLAAVGTALICGIPPETIRGALATFSPPARRLEVLQVGDYTVINDVAMNEGSYESVLETMTALGYPQLVVVNAIRGNRGAEVNARIARVLARWNRQLDFAPLIVTASRSHVTRYSADYHVRPEELAAFLGAARREGLSVCVHEELPPAIEEGVARLRPGGALLLLGTFGMDDGARIAADCLRRR